MNLGKILCDIFSILEKEMPKIYSTHNLLCTKGSILIQTITNFILCDFYSEIHLKIRVHKRELCMEKDCIMNIRDLCHEYKGYAS